MMSSNSSIAGDLRWSLSYVNGTGSAISSSFTAMPFLIINATLYPIRSDFAGGDHAEFLGFCRKGLSFYPQTGILSPRLIDFSLTLV